MKGTPSGTSGTVSVRLPLYWALERFEPISTSRVSPQLKLRYEDYKDKRSYPPQQPPKTDQSFSFHESTYKVGLFLSAPCLFKLALPSI